MSSLSAHSFVIQERTMLGKSALKALRKSGFLPAVIYSSNAANPTIQISLNTKEFNSARASRQLKGRLVRLRFANADEINVILREIQIDPLTEAPIHVDFQSLGDSSTVSVDILVHVINADKCQALKQGGVLNTIHRQIPFICPVDFIPTQLNIDITDLAIGHSIHINDIKLRAGIHPVDRSNFPIVSISGNADTTNADNAQA